MVKKHVLSKPAHETVHEKNVEIPMRDGTVSRANITRPRADGRFPVLLERTPYDKESSSESGPALNSPDFYSKRGYVVAIQDVRGRYASDGDFYPFRDDGAGIRRDGYDTVEWLGGPPRCKGKVGVIGGA